MRVFVRNPGYTVATELIQPSMMQQQMNSQVSSVVPQQPPYQQQQQQQPPPPLVQQQQQSPQGVPNNGNFVYQQQQQHQLPPHLNPMPHLNNNNFQPNGNMNNGMQVPMQQQQPLPMQPPALPPPTPTTTTTSTSAPSTTTETNEDDYYSNLANDTDIVNETLPNLTDSSPPVLTEKQVETLSEVKEEVESENVDEEEEDNGDDETDEDEDQDEEEEKKSDPTEVEVLEEENQMKNDPIEQPVIETFDLPGLHRHTPIGQLRTRSLEQGMDTPLIVTEKASSEDLLNTTEPVSLVEESAIKTSLEVDADKELPSAETPLVSEEETNSTSSIPVAVSGEATVETIRVENHLNETDSMEPISPPTDLELDGKVVDSAAAVVDTVMETIAEVAEQPTVMEVEEENTLANEKAEDADNSTLMSASLDVSTADVNAVTQEPIMRVEGGSDSPIEPEIRKEEETIPILEEAPKELEAPVIETAQTSESTGENNLHDVKMQQEEESKETTVQEPSHASTEGSGGGLLDSALNWLGISDLDELLKEVAQDASSLQKEIADLDPSLHRDGEKNFEEQQQEELPQEKVHQKEELPQPVEVPIDGFCHSDDCANIAQPAVPKEEESLSPSGPPVTYDVPQTTMEVDDHYHSHQNHDDHSHSGHSHSHDDYHGSQDSHHGHSHDHHESHDLHHGHSHDHHGHSHIPGYIPGFGHHYKKPQQQQAPPPVEQKEELEAVIPPPLEPVESQLPASQIMEQVPSEIPAATATDSSSSNVPDYIPVEEIFRAEMEKRKLLEEQQQQSENLGSEEDVVSWFKSTLLSFLPILHDFTTESGSGSGAEARSSVLYPVVVGVLVVLFLSFHYLIQGRSQEKWLKAKISQLDAQLYESQSAKEECGTIQTQLTEYETEAADLRSRVDQTEIEKVALSRRVADLERERDGLEKELETATETATEANRMFEELLASQSESDDLQQSVEALEQKLTQQHLAIETLSASLSIKTTENETLINEAEELRAETERYKVRVKTLQSDLETMKTSNRNYQQKANQEGAELLKLKQEKESWSSERRTLTGQLNRQTKEATEWRDKAESLKKAIKAKEADLAKSLELLKQSAVGGSGGGIDSQAVMQLSSLVQLEVDLTEANAKIEALELEVKVHAEQTQTFEAEKQALRDELEQLLNSTQSAAKEKLEAETRLQVKLTKLHN